MANFWVAPLVQSPTCRPLPFAGPEPATCMQRPLTALFTKKKPLGASAEMANCCDVAPLHARTLTGPFGPAGPASRHLVVSLTGENRQLLPAGVIWNSEVGSLSAFDHWSAGSVPVSTTSVWSEEGMM